MGQAVYELRTMEKQSLGYFIMIHEVSACSHESCLAFFQE
jgi:hypothetical protein